MAKKRRYRTTSVKRVHVQLLCEDVEGQHVVLGVDVAKTGMVGALVDGKRAVRRTISWSHPKDTDQLLELLASVREVAASVSVAMEPSGTYGDALRWQCLSRGFDVHRVNAKHTHDMAEVYDGVPSKHDAKDAAIVAQLFLDGRSTPWGLRSVRERELVAAVKLLDVYDGQLRQGLSRLEAQLARHWPELTGWLTLDSATLLELLCSYGGPSGVAEEPVQARERMRKVGGSQLSEEKVVAVVASASTTLGMPQLSEEVALVRALALDARRAQRSLREAKRRVEGLSAAAPSTRSLQKVVGKTTAGVLVAATGDPQHFDCPRAYVKALGLNLRERSSGRKRGQLHITKRGSGTARQWLYMACLRLLASDAVVRAWYAAKVARDGGRSKVRAVVAVMRKVALALWYVARGDAFDATKLFDVRRLAVTS